MFVRVLPWCSLNPWNAVLFCIKHNNHKGMTKFIQTYFPVPNDAEFADFIHGMNKGVFKRTFCIKHISLDFIDEIWDPVNGWLVIITDILFHTIDRESRIQGHDRCWRVPHLELSAFTIFSYIGNMSHYCIIIKQLKYPTESTFVFYPLMIFRQSASINLCRHWPVGDLWPSRITISPWAEKVVH